jgi:hypothetical protein
MMKATGASTVAPGIRYGRSASGTWRRKAPMDSGAPAYISTLAPVIRPTSECQLGKGSRKNSPMMKAQKSPIHGMPFRSVLVRAAGAYLFRARP